jgi:hypothetical protein
MGIAGVEPRQLTMSADVDRKPLSVPRVVDVFPCLWSLIGRLSLVVPRFHLLFLHGSNMPNQLVAAYFAQCFKLRGTTYECRFLWIKPVCKTK